MEHLLEYDNFLNETIFPKDSLGWAFESWNKRNPKKHIMKVIKMPNQTSWNFLAHAEMNKWPVGISVVEDAGNPNVSIKVSHVDGKPTKEYDLIQKLAMESLFKLKGASKTISSGSRYFDVKVPKNGNVGPIVDFVEKCNNMCWNEKTLPRNIY